MFKYLLKLLSKVGSVGQRLKYGFEHDSGIVSVPFAASVVVPVSGGFVTSDASGYMFMTTSTDVTVFGFVIDAATTCSATKGTTVLSVNVNPSAIYRIPILTGTADATYVGKKMAISVNSTTQGLQIGSTASAHVIVVDIDSANNKWADVKVIPAILTGR